MTTKFARIAAALVFLLTFSIASRPVRAVEYAPPEIFVPEGFVAQLAAAPPLVRHPLMAGFDDRGRLFVAESAGRNLKRAELEKELPNFIRMLEDADSDGVFDKSTIFADKLTLPQGALWHRGALYVCSPPSLWRFEDTDDDGVADRREEIVTGFGYTGNAASIHGPFLGPTGRLFWCDGRHGHEIRDAHGKLISKGRSARIFSCRPDGSDLRTHCGGGMDNPVEVDFLPTGEMLGTVNLFYRQRGDCLVHWVRGGVYPRYDQPDCLAEFPSTGEPLTEVHNFGHVAVSGCTRYRSGKQGFGKEFTDNFFVTQFNTHQVVRTVLTRDGGTFSAEEHPFLQSPSPDFHPTDVLEDADGSLLVIDTGGWFRLGCPTSQIAKPNIHGAIWRIRRANAHKPVDPRGLQINWNRLADRELTNHLADDRPAVRDRAIDALTQRGENVVPEIARLLRGANVATKQHAVWTLAHIGAPPARARLREILGDSVEDQRVILAAQSALGALQDAHALRSLAFSMSEERPATLRGAADAIGQIGPIAGEDAVANLLVRMPKKTDRVTEHAYTRALIDLNHFDYTMTRFPQHQTRATLIALREMPSSRLKREDVMPLLTAQDEALRQTAWETIAARPDWSAGIERLIRQLCEGSETRLIDLDTMHGAVVAFAHVQAVQEQIGELLVSPRVNSLVRARLLRAIGEAPTAQWPASWKPGVIKAIDRSQRDVQWAAVRAVAAREQAEFAPHLETIVENPKAPMGMRVDSAVGLAHFARPLNGTAYALLNAQLQTDDALSRLEAARAIGRAKLNEVQLTELASATSKLGTLELSAVIGAFAQSQDATIGLALMDALRKSPAMKTVSASRRTEAFANFPAEIKTQAAELFAADSSTATQQAQRLDFLLNGLTTGDAERGRELFFGRRAACASCHRVGSNGATVGPDLSTVGVRRSARDLIEAIAFPSASIARGFESFTFTTTRGKIHAGIILNQTPAAIQIRTGSQDVLWLDRGDVEEISPSPVSIMPEGLDRTLTATELSDLTAYLKSRK